MNINEEAVHDMLETQVGKGRNIVEAAGEGRWLAEVQKEQGVLSRQTRDEMINVINEWLAARLNVPSDEVHLYAFVAELYARFLKRRVDFGAGHDPMGMAERAWHEWRSTTRGSTQGR